MKEKVESALRRVRPKLGSAEVQLVDVSEGIVRLRYFTPASGTEKLTRGRMTEEVVLEIVEEALRKEIPEVKEVIVAQVVTGR